MAQIYVIQYNHLQAESSHGATILKFFPLYQPNQPKSLSLHLLKNNNNNCSNQHVLEKYYRSISSKLRLLLWCNQKGRELKQ